MPETLEELYLRQPHLSDGKWVVTYTGTYYSITNPLAEDVHLMDIAHALSQVNRWTGHTTVPFSVAQHSVVCSYLVPQAFALRALLHDAQEHILADVNRPAKSELPQYSALEARHEAVIAQAAGIIGPCMTPEVKAADNLALALEYRDLFSIAAKKGPWVPDGDVSGIPPLVALGHAEAKLQFLRRYFELTGDYVLPLERRVATDAFRAGFEFAMRDFGQTITEEAKVCN